MEAGTSYTLIRLKKNLEKMEICSSFRKNREKRQESGKWQGTTRHKAQSWFLFAVRQMT
jgi:hypothetical protein